MDEIEIVKSPEQQKAYYKKYGLRYSKFIYYVEKEISVEDSPYAMDYNLLGIRMYIIINRTNHFRFLYLTTRKLFIDTEILGKSLFFLKHQRYDFIKLKFFKDIFDEKQLTFIDTNSTELSKYELKPTDILIKEINDPNLNEGDEPKKKLVFPKNIHTSRVCFDNTNWFKDELKGLDFDNLHNTIMDDILAGAIIDDRIKKVLITEFFELPQVYDIEENKSIDYMKNNSHSIVLTQGSTGKSSILCLLGNDLTKTSDAGMFGYMDVTNNSWRAGEVSKTKKAIIVDEINEIIDSNAKKGESVLDTLNTPLENGKFNYGKAGGMKINFGNQFNFLGNIRDNFHFENFVNGLASNQSTMGRRFSYLIYDDKVEWTNGKQRNITKHLNKINPIREFLSNVLLYFLEKINFIDEKINTNIEFLARIERDKVRLNDLIRPIEHPNTKQFLKTFIEFSILNRITIMALKLTLYARQGEFLTLDSLENYSLEDNGFMKDYFNSYGNIIIDIEQSIKNIVSHQNESIITESSNEILSKKLHNDLSNNQKLLILRIGESNPELKIKIKYSELKIKGKLKFIKANLLKRGSSPKDKILNKYGVFPKVENNEVFFTINKRTFEKSLIICEKSKMEILEKAGETSYNEEDDNLEKEEPEIESDEVEIEDIDEQMTINEMNKSEYSENTEIEVISLEDEIVETKIEETEEIEDKTSENIELEEDRIKRKSSFDIDEILMDDDII